MTTENTTTDILTVNDLEAADKVAGRAYRDSDHIQMLPSMEIKRDELKAIRCAVFENSIAPAFEFQPLLPGIALPSGKSCFHVSRGKIPAYNGDIESLAFATAIDLSRLIKSGKITSVKLTKMYLARLKKYGTRLKCVVNLCEELALQQAETADIDIADGNYRGPLHGIPYGAKDLFATRGIPTTYGIKPYEHQIFDYDATVIERMSNAGAVLVAKLSMGELAMEDIWFGGKTRNPWHSEQGSSGSSAGSGSATAAGLVGFSIGTETLGSIVSPCVRTGVTGLRPTFGRISRFGAMALSWTMDKVGPMCRGVEDCAIVFHALYGPDGKDLTVSNFTFDWNPRTPLNEIRVGVDQAAFQALKSDTKSSGKVNIFRNEARWQIYQNVLTTLEGIGVELVPVTLPENSPARSAISVVVLEAESAASQHHLNRSGQFDELVQQGQFCWPNIVRVASTIPASDYLQAQRLRRILQMEMAEALKNVDVYLSVPFIGPSLVYTNLTGHPTVITRCGMLEGEPQSVEFVGGLYKESAALRVAFAYEQATSWHTQWPEVDKLPLVPPEVKSSNCQ